MEMNLALSCEELGIFLQKQNSNSMLLNDVQIPTRAISSALSLKPPKIMLLISTLSFVKSC
jgi:hypothetical protein